MEVMLRHMGFSPARNVHQYKALAESGWAGLFEDEDFVSDGSYDLPDELFSLDSGSVSWLCDSCGLLFNKRTRPGAVIHCPLCDAEAQVPVDAKLEDWYAEE